MQYNKIKQTTNQNSLFRSRDWLSAKQGPVFPGSVGSGTRRDGGNKYLGGCAKVVKS